MADRRMFTKKITNSDAFLEMSSATQALYFHLNQEADDDGFNNQIQAAMFRAHASIDDLKVLLMKNFIIRFESGVIVIKHWRMHNTLRKDRYNPTNFQDELSLLNVKDNGAYTLVECHGCQLVANPVPQVSIGKDSIDKINKKSSHFVPPTPEEVKAYCTERKNNVDPQKFFDYFNTPDTQGRTWIDSKGNKVKNWKQKIITWEQHSGPDSSKKPEQPKPNKFNSHPTRGYTAEDYSTIEQALRNKGL